MIKMRVGLIIGVFLLFISCDSNTLYRKLDRNFESNQWKSSDVKTHEFELKETTPNGKIQLKFAHVFDYQFESVPIIIEIVYPNFETEKRTINLQLKDKNGKEIGDCSGDICDLNYIILEGEKIQKGKYTIRISNNFKNGYLPNILAIGIEVIQ